MLIVSRCLSQRFKILLAYVVRNALMFVKNVELVITANQKVTTVSFIEFLFSKMYIVDSDTKI